MQKEVIPGSWDNVHECNIISEIKSVVNNLLVINALKHTLTLNRQQYIYIFIFIYSSLVINEGKKLASKQTSHPVEPSSNLRSSD
jgi:hypothetical protein